MYGWLTFYHQGHDVHHDFKPYMLDLQFRIQKVQFDTANALSHYRYLFDVTLQTRSNFDATRDQTDALMKRMLELRNAVSLFFNPAF